MEILFLNTLNWRLIYCNIADILTYLVYSFVDDGSEEIIQNIEKIIDYCISGMNKKIKFF